VDDAKIETDEETDFSDFPEICPWGTNEVLNRQETAAIRGL